MSMRVRFVHVHGYPSMRRVLAFTDVTDVSKLACRCHLSG